MRKIVVITTDGDSRENGNVYYCRFLLVESDNPKLTFAESIFHKKTGMPGDKIIEAIKALGYSIEEPDNEYIIEEDSEPDEDNDSYDYQEWDSPSFDDDF